MSNWNNIKKESALNVALVVLCQEYILFDDEFLNNRKIKRNMSNSAFWIELAEELKGVIRTNLISEQEGYDELDEVAVSEDEILNYVMDTEHRFNINDMICETIEAWLKHFDRNRF